MKLFFATKKQELPQKRTFPHIAQFQTFHAVFIGVFSDFGETLHRHIDVVVGNLRLNDAAGECLKSPPLTVKQKDSRLIEVSSTRRPPFLARTMRKNVNVLYNNLFQFC